MEVIQNYIGGELMPAKSGATLENIEPAKGKIYGTIPDSDATDVQSAVEAAEAAFPAWSKTPREERSRLMLKVAELIDQNLDRLAAAESKDNGKPLKLAKRVDIPRASANFRFFATAILHESSDFHQTDEEAINMTLRSPLGVVGCISPWNLPLYLFTWKIAPAIAAGNTVVAKPSEVTPMTAYLLSELCIEAGLPKGVLNIVHGLGPKVGQAMSEHPKIKAISFTGGTATGKQIAATAAPMFKKLSLELGGKNPNIIFADCDFDKALATTVHSSFANQGQICLCGSRIFIERAIYDKFKTAFIEKVKSLKVGPPEAEDTKVGAVVSEPHMNKVLSYIELAKEEGGTILFGGERVVLEGDFQSGYYIQPTIIEGLSYDCRTNQEEIFGPVVTLTPFDSEEEVLIMANTSQYGLSSTIWTTDLNRANRVAKQIQAGIVWVNTWLFRDLRTPFGGVKNSGVGREGGWAALDFFTEKKNVCIKL
ncbi:aminomuconate-semialdehyde/2-hydroxymuconate-6-semialdehyde dehydrogenase [Roseivirga pacifica]|uniref:Aminomuconate-semialdehyde/2-hydroxymuconate-6-semialdehyde dehydrogenase n=1 Tax=Roseivirga pacifica TaxID=1267423 RepID=A0A1I0NIT6_9BACT|nr:aldehyde dehydrogenase [Roseivirga pacifica]RKQ51222.1 aminomuconate-semialdehyde/2-hydroxymuconate-6-semialdehyde dehydrogenase [Roseivirga pacifica]SEW01206.1 aminomuconate-semialdehyde/2-hydroxymuconate-6-semialdehyde dehydrogenase [Roseivirga pacifica]